MLNECMDFSRKSTIQTLIGAQMMIAAKDPIFRSSRRSKLSDLLSVALLYDTFWGTGFVPHWDSYLRVL